MLFALTRGLFVAGILSGFGTAVFAAIVFRGATQCATARQLRVILLASLGLALLAGLAWLVLQTIVMAETKTASETAAQIPAVLFGTRFGQVLILQTVAGIAAFMLLRRATLAAVLLGIAVLLESGHSHSFAMGDRLLVASQAVHLLAAGAWLGGLVPLLLAVRSAPFVDAQEMFHGFSSLALPCVIALAGTALWQGVALSGSWAGLFDTDYGRVLLIKAVLFAVLLAIAANNRLRLMPALRTAEAGRARRGLLWSIAIETALGLLVVLAAAALSGLEPGMHLGHG
jgi:copper resistance protein D